jgi:hypothetical protein
LQLKFLKNESQLTSHRHEDNLKLSCLQRKSWRTIRKYEDNLKLNLFNKKACVTIRKCEDNLKLKFFKNKTQQTGHINKKKLEAELFLGTKLGPQPVGNEKKLKLKFLTLKLST